MGRVWTWGCEIGAIDSNEFANSNLNINTATVRTGDCAYTFGNNGSVVRRTLASALTELYTRGGCYPVSPHVTAQKGMMNFRNADGESIAALLVEANTGKLQACIWTDGAWSVLATSSNSLTLDTYQCLEVHLKLSDTVGIFEVRIDGSLIGWIDFDGDTIGDQTPASIIQVAWGASGSNPYNRIDTVWDDFAINDISGAVDNSWCGQGGVYPLRPTGEGDHTGMTPSAGANWQCVDEIAPSDTDYVYTDTADVYDLYACNDPTPDPVAGTVVTVRVFARAKLAEAGAGSIATQVKTEATEYSGSSVALDTTAKYLSTIYDLNPQTGIAWTLDEVKALQIGAIAK